MLLSSVRDNGVVLIGGRKAIVVDRSPPDRASGVTRVQFESGGQETFVWDRNDPEVEHLGRGKLEVKIQVSDAKYLTCDAEVTGIKVEGGTKYVLGFAMTTEETCRRVLLVKKARPDWQKGKLNGLGGEIEAGETPLDAMVREFREETGLATDPISWIYFATLEDKGNEVHCYYMFMPRERLDEADSPDEEGSPDAEELYTVRVDDLMNQKTIPNVRYLVPMALDKTIETVRIRSNKNKPT